MEFKADILEGEILSTFGREVLERLLRCHSRKHAAIGNKKADDTDYLKYHIVWATDDYSENGDGFRASDRITVDHITKQYGELIQPRAVKSIEIQRQRTQQRAEVFTPAWVCNAQNNLVDNAWFESHGKTVREGGWFNAENDHSWTTNEQPLFSESDGDLWHEYIKDIRIEITCGEAPYLVSRYDATDGSMIEPISHRIGLLDRKLRVVNEHCPQKEDWLSWSEEALKSTYGFEFQGDNLLLAREALFLTMVRYYYEKFDELPNKDSCKMWAYIISWNIFQMDGLTYKVPFSEYEKEITTLFGTEKEKVIGINAVIRDWSKKSKTIEEFKKSVTSK